MSEYDIDSQLKDLLDTLRPVPERNPDAKYRSQRRFNADLDAFFPTGAPRRSSLSAPFALPVEAVAPPAPIPARSPRPAPRPSRWYERPMFAYLAIASFMLVAMFGGGFVTVLAAGSALPGDVLYPVKLNAEQARVNLVSDPARQADLYLEFAQNRIAEINAVTALGRYEAIGPLAMRFNRSLSLAADKAQRLTGRDPARAMRLQIQVTQSLGLLKQTVGLAILKAPPAMQSALQNTLDQALQLTPPADNANEGNRGGGNAGNNDPGRNNSNANSNANGAPGSAVNNNSNDNSNANPNSNKDKDKDKDKDKEEKDKDKDKEEKDKDKDKEEKDK